ncbi:MAG: DUF2938 domain-containing protein [Ignavibacteria bacterium]|nr:DUF2938 domain-containing protein [Ignavibacteria bacterium]MBT8383565.1 DUF2938 domain-containing protein [Ignavibacteria bacterium]NNJ52585.1 DUF2938 family protein [Ignavibacteriaceae bacterium]NNL22566.1 DUF2938 family protein [Ignavibacteriaceae bacterium]
MIVIEMILMGSFATYFMDLTGGFLVKRKFVHSFIEPETVGRWTLYMLRGKLMHKDIRQTPALKNEKLTALIFHYLIGIVLAGIYLFLELNEPTIRDQIWISLIFGIATVVLPWFWLFPSIGLGFLASKSPNKSSILKTSLINHTNFGVGLFIWVVISHRFFI